LYDTSIQHMPRGRKVSSYLYRFLRKIDLSFPNKRLSSKTKEIFAAPRSILR
jgi:hypothetical protein